MKAKVKSVKDVLKSMMEEGVDRVRRSKKGYGDEHTGDDYHDVSEELELEDFMDDEEECEEGVSQSKRAAHGYDLEDPTDYDVPGEGLSEDQDRMRRAGDNYGDSEFDEVTQMEVAPPSDKAEEFIQKNKGDFKKRYGERWKEVLYATAHEKFPSKGKKEAAGDPGPPPSPLSKMAGAAKQMIKGPPPPATPRSPGETFKVPSHLSSEQDGGALYHHLKKQLTSRLPVMTGFMKAAQSDKMKPGRLAPSPPPTSPMKPDEPPMKMASKMPKLSKVAEVDSCDKKKRKKH
jgi:hypothetical protein